MTHTMQTTSIKRLTKQQSSQCRHLCTCRFQLWSLQSCLLSPSPDWALPDLWLSSASQSIQTLCQREHMLARAHVSKSNGHMGL